MQSQSSSCSYGGTSETRRARCPSFPHWHDFAAINARDGSQAGQPASRSVCPYGRRNAAALALVPLRGGVVLRSGRGRPSHCIGPWATIKELGGRTLVKFIAKILFPHIMVVAGRTTGAPLAVARHLCVPPTRNMSWSARIGIFTVFFCQAPVRQIRS